MEGNYLVEVDAGVILRLIAETLQGCAKTDLDSVGDQLTFRYLDADIASAACGILQRMTVVGSGHEGGKAGTVFLGSSENGTAVDLAHRQRLLQRRLLAGTDGSSVKIPSDSDVGSMWDLCGVLKIDPTCHNTRGNKGFRR